MVKRQLELSLGRTPEGGDPSRPASLRFGLRRRRQSRSHWWFDRMRQVVDEALDVEPAPRDGEGR